MNKLGPFNRKRFRESVKELDAFLAGRPTKAFTKPEYDAPVTPKEAKAARHAAHLSQPRFAEALGLSPSTVRSWEAGRRRPGALESKVLRATTMEPKFLRLLEKV